MKTMATTDKDQLFDDFFVTLAQVIPIFENVFEVGGLSERILGTDQILPSFDKELERAARERVKSSRAWERLSALYDYAIDGIQPDGVDNTSIVIDGAEVLSLTTTENYAPAAAWRQIVRLADGRAAIDLGEEILLDKLALLAKVDERTVRNAISSGELRANKTNGAIFIENASARTWLNGRRGYKPTRILSVVSKAIDEVSTAPEFGAFLARRRQIVTSTEAGLNATVQHPAVDAKALQELEHGTFTLPLDTVVPLADFYNVDRGAFFACLMRVFYRDELDILTRALKKS